MYRRIPNHSYLCKILPDVNPSVIDYIVNKELSLARGEKMEELTSEPRYSDLNIYLRTSFQLANLRERQTLIFRKMSEDRRAGDKPSFFRLDSQLHFLPFVRSGLRHLPFSNEYKAIHHGDSSDDDGILYFRKAFKNLTKQDPSAVLDALCDVKDIIEDREKCLMALEHDLLSRLGTLSHSKNDCVREGCATLISIIAEHEFGQMAIYSSTASLRNLQLHIADQNIWIRYKACSTLYHLVSNRMGADAIIKAGFLPFLLKRLLQDERDIIVVILETLTTLLQRDVKQMALQLGALPILIHFVFDIYSDISLYAQYCLESLLVDRCLRVNIDDETLRFLKTRIYETDRETNLKSLAVYKLLSTSTFLIRRIAVPEIIDHILKIAQKFICENEVLLDCFTVLLKMCDTPAGRRNLEKRKFFIINAFIPDD